MLDPQAAAVLEELAGKALPMPADQGAWLRAYRRELDEIVAMQGPAPAARVREDWVASGHAAPIPMRLYQPDTQGPWPTVLYIHGGGFVAGSLEAYDIPLRHLCLRSGWRVAAIDYRLAPEYPYPAAPDDCMAALRHVLASADVKADCLAVMGDSAGGALAAVIARRARAANLPLRLQVLLYPNTDLRETDLYPSRAAHDGKIVRIDELYRSLDLYCGAADRADPDLSPGLARDLAGLCPALVVTCECDPLRDDGAFYAARLRDAGVSVEAERLDGMIHGVFQRGARIAAGDALISRVAARLKAIA
jgi:acetyl esterase